jgi:glycosyltransferase involved in cell wall biosynthesis
MTSNLPAAVISLSRRMLTRLEDTGLFGEVPHKFIIHGASNARINATPRANRAPGSPIVIGYLGRMEKDTKGIEVLLDATRKLPAQQISVLLGGKGDEAYMDELRASYAGGNVEFLGFVKPAEFLQRIDVLVVPSVWEEPLGRVIYEAYAQGVPAIVADVGGMPEIVETGRTGFVFRSRDSEDLARILRDQIAAGWRGADFSAACVGKSADFSIDRVFADYMRVWETAIRTQGGARRQSLGNDGSRVESVST